MKNRHFINSIALILMLALSLSSCLRQQAIDDAVREINRGLPTTNDIGTVEKAYYDKENDCLVFVCAIDNETFNFAKQAKSILDTDNNASLVAGNKDLMKGLSSIKTGVQLKYFNPDHSDSVSVHFDYDRLKQLKEDIYDGRKPKFNLLTQLKEELPYMKFPDKIDEAVTITGMSVEDNKLIYKVQIDIPGLNYRNVSKSDIEEEKKGIQEGLNQNPTFMNKIRENNISLQYDYYNASGDSICSITI